MLASLAPAPASAQSNASSAPAANQRWWLAAEAGYASVALDPGPDGSDSQTGWTIGFSGGVRVTPRLRVGVELGGFNLEAGNLWDPSRGEAVSQVFAVVRYTLRPDRGLFGMVGAGWSEYINNSPEHFAWEGSGWGMTMGIGYAIPAGRSWSLAPTLRYTRGTVSPGGAPSDYLDYSATSLSLAVCFP